MNSVSPFFKKMGLLSVFLMCVLKQFGQSRSNPHRFYSQTGCKVLISFQTSNIRFVIQYLSSVFHTFYSKFNQKFQFPVWPNGQIYYTYIFNSDPGAIGFLYFLVFGSIFTLFLLCMTFQDSYHTISRYQVSYSELLA